MRHRRADVLVVGAGAAGLAAARELCREGLEVLVIEARRRMGGRVYTLHDPQAPVPVELGAEFVHGEAPETFAIARDAGLIIDEIPDEHLLYRRGRLLQTEGFWPTVARILQKLHRTLRGRDLSFGEAFDPRGASPGVRDLIMLFVEGYYASRADRISARWVASGPEKSANRQFRLSSGNDAVIHWLRAGLPRERSEIRMNTIVNTIRWKPGEVIVEATTGTGRALDPFQARAAVVTLPVGVLKAKSVRFVPEVPAKDRALQRLEMGQAFKIVLRFRRVFWKHRLNFAHAPDLAVPTWWTHRPAQLPVFTGWAGGRRAEALLDVPEHEQVDRALESLSRVLSIPRRTVDDLLDAWWTHNWRSDPFSRGAYMYVGVGGIPAQRALARPVAGTLFFAGEATDPEHAGTVEGAIASGRRAAREVLAALHNRHR